MNTPYHLTANIEWTSKCNAKCAMCPRHAISHPQLMSPETYTQVMARLRSEDLHRAIVAGYGEPTTHPRFFEFVEGMRSHPVHFDMVSNGERLDAERLEHLDGAIGMLMVSFSSIDPAVYRRIHTNLKQEKVIENLKLARRIFRKTHLSVSLTPAPECLASLPDTIEWFHANGIDDLRMSPNFYNRAGKLAEDPATRNLRAIIREYNLKPLDLDFIPSMKDMLGQWWRNDFKCIPRNTSMFITASGEYLYCYNDISHNNTLGHVRDLSFREALALRERSKEDKQLCEQCNMRHRYRGKELAQAALGYFKGYVVAAG